MKINFNDWDNLKNHIDIYFYDKNYMNNKINKKHYIIFFDDGVYLIGFLLKNQLYIYKGIGEYDLIYDNVFKIPYKNGYLFFQKDGDLADMKTISNEEIKNIKNGNYKICNDMKYRTALLTDICFTYNEYLNILN